jgi:hypothetical protein
MLYYFPLCGIMWYYFLLCGTIFYYVVLCGIFLLCGTMWYNLLLCGVKSHVSDDCRTVKVGPGVIQKTDTEPEPC